MHSLRPERPLDHHLGLCQATLHIPMSHYEMFCDIAGCGSFAGGSLGVEVVMQHHSIRLHGCDWVRHMG